MQIRKCTEDDITDVGVFYDKVVLWLDSHINYPKWLYKEYPSEQSARAMTAEGSQYICEEDGKIIGAFVLNDDPQGAYEKGDWKLALSEGEYMIIHAFAMDPEYQGKGYGSEVVSFCKEKAKEEGYKAIRLDIVPGNTPAQKLYEKNGFSYAGTYDLDRGYEHIPEFCLFEYAFMKEAYFAGGCFWCVTPIYKMYGVDKVICGYAGGDEENPTYEQVKHQQTGHRETIKLVYDPEKVTYEKLLDIYFANVDPFDPEGQFIDKGFSYTLAVFYNDETEKDLAEKKIKEIEEGAGKKTFVALLPFKNFYEAEDYHQDYYLKNPEAFEKELVESGRKNNG